MTEKDQIEQLSYHILSSYFEYLDIEPLLSSLAEDIVWLGAGKEMCLSGKQAVSEAFRLGIQTMHPCLIRNPEYTTKQLGPSYWLCQICSDLVTVPEAKIYLQEHQRCAFLFRRNTEAENSTTWELVYLNNSLSYNVLQKESFFATEQGMRNYQRLHQVDITQLSAKDKQELFALVERSAYEPLDADTQELFLILSQFQYFSTTQAIYMWQQLRAKEMLWQETQRHAFLYQDGHSKEYHFHPVYAEYLRTQFARQPKLWQRQHILRAGRWFLQAGSYEEAIRKAYVVRDYETILAAVEKGGLEALFFLSPTTAQDILAHCPLSQQQTHIKGFLFLLLHTCLTQGTSIFSTYGTHCLQLIRHTPLPQTLRQEYTSFWELVAAICAYPQLPKMTAHMQKAMNILPMTEYVEPIQFPWTFGSPSVLEIYHHQPGNLNAELRQLQSFLETYPYRQVSWYSFVHDEAAYMTGNIPEAKRVLQRFIDTVTSQSKHIDAYISALFYLTRLSIYTEDITIIEKRLSQIHVLALEAQPNYHVSLLTLCEAYITALINPLPNILRDTQQRLEDLTGYTPCRPIICLITDCLSLALQDYPKVIIKAQETIARYPQHILTCIYEYILLAAAYEQSQCIDSAMQALHNALTLAAPDRIVLPFAEYAAYIPRTIVKIQQQSMYVDFLQHVQDLSMAHSLAALRDSYPAKPSQVTTKLSYREQEVARLVSQGKTNKEIAQTLHIAEITVKKTLSYLYKKLGVTNRAALVQYMTTYHSF